jgi:hypothetical protein
LIFDFALVIILFYLFRTATSAIGKLNCPKRHDDLSDVDYLDHKTDTAIQTSLQHELGRDTTVITIAHRLQTIMDADKIVSLADLVFLYRS